MINFRYHVVSLTAVFLALAIGLVVGTAALNGPVADSLKSQVDGLSKDNSNYRDQANQYLDELNRAQEFATEVAPALLAGKLTDRRLLLLVLPAGQDHADGVAAMLTMAGAKITARVAVQDKFFDPAVQYDELLDLADQASQPTIPADGLPANSDGAETAAALLARALLQKTPEVTPGDLTAVLTAFSKAGYLTVDDNATGGAEGTVIVSGLPAVDRDAAKKSQAALTLTTQFSNRPLVVAGTGIGEGNLVSQVRGDPRLLGTISTVDDVSTEQGRVATAMACAEEMAGRTGHYGVEAGATSLVPKAAP